jgi:hypothetical protein
MDEVLLRFESMFETVVCTKNCSVEGKVMKGIKGGNRVEQTIRKL